MDETIRTAAISLLRQRLIDDMNMRRFSRATQHSYIRDVGRFATASAPYGESIAPAGQCSNLRPPAI
jgi:hypothetical protein